ncbi:hypothetical protein Droror1_Dr00015236, partial [Drosera rotundifolia]
MGLNDCTSGLLRLDVCLPLELEMAKINDYGEESYLTGALLKRRVPDRYRHIQKGSQMSRL